jgi:hypothetical protein
MAHSAFIPKNKISKGLGHLQFNYVFSDRNKHKKTGCSFFILPEEKV